ncbi:MAG: PAAR domain-containing protein [Rhizobiaceae bacterium]|nr:PAAR domain-containing protein [Rhizobiaceae bacterium]MCV0405825.1 PAAR domain-containing protein [Rhizobiaceae bacterium]
MSGMPAARLTDRTSHASAGALVGAAAGALVGGLALGPVGALAGAAVGAIAGAMLLNIPTGTIIPPCFPPVLVGFLPSARVLDLHQCIIHFTNPNTIVTGSSTVLVGGLPAARISDKTFCAAEISTGQPNVLIGGPVVLIPFNIQGDTAFVTEVQKAMATLYGTRTGQVIINDIAASGNTVTIVPTADQNGYCSADDHDASHDPSEGSDSTVSWNPTYSSPTDPHQTPTIVLGHELVHAHHNATGTHHDGPHDSYPGQTGSSNRGEERATVGAGGTSVTAPDGTTQTVPDHSADVPTENSLRDDLGVPRRPSYYPPNWPGGAPW